MGIKVFEVSNNRELNIFSRVPEIIYHDDPLWIPTRSNQVAKKLMQIPRRNIILLVAVVDNLVVGRVAGMINPRHPEKNTALFGYFESINDKSVPTELLKKTELWAIKKGYSYLTGPVSYNTNDSIGLLLEGFTEPQQHSMPYNPYYYPDLMENAGLKKHLDLFAYLWSAKDPVPPKLTRIVKKVHQTAGLVLRQINLNHIEKEASLLSIVHNKTMQDNWGAESLPVSSAANYLRAYRSFADPKLLLAAEVNGEPAGICLTLPNPDSHRKNGKNCRVAILAVVPKFRSKGIAALLMHETAVRLSQNGYQQAELSLILENNTMMNRILKKFFNFEIIKRFRVYRKGVKD